MNIENINKQHPPINQSPTFQCEKNVSLIYNKKKIQWKITTKYVQYSDNAKTIHLIQPTAILFNDTATPMWNIKAQKAKITHDKIMYLYGNIQINSCIKHSYLRFITTNTATLNLITYDIFSNEKTTIHGTQFNIIAINMTGNLKKKMITLSQKVYVLYETKTPKKI